MVVCYSILTLCFLGVEANLFKLPSRFTYIIS